MASLPDSGVIDADGHVLEDSTLWDEYLEERYRERAIRVVPNEDGWDVLIVDGQVFPYFAPGTITSMGTMDEGPVAIGPERRYMESRPRPAADARARIEHSERAGLDRALLYPTIGLQWECVVPDADLCTAYLRAYNRWLADFCRDSQGRLVPIAHISLTDVELAVAEIERALDDGCKGAFVSPFTHTRIPLGHPDHDRFWAAAQSLDCPVAIHPTQDPPSMAVTQRFEPFDGLLCGSPLNTWNSIVFAPQGVIQAFGTFFGFATFDRFPRLKIGVLESSSGWIGSFLDRLDVLHETAAGRATGLKQKPSDYFRRQCFISSDPDERAVPRIIEQVGSECFFWASDYPHGDHSANWLENLAGFLEPLGPEARNNVLGANVRRVYNLD